MLSAFALLGGRKVGQCFDALQELSASQEAQGSTCAGCLRASPSWKRKEAQQKKTPPLETLWKAWRRGFELCCLPLRHLKT